MAAGLYALLSLVVAIIAVHWLKRLQITKSTTIAIILAIPLLVLAVNSEVARKLSAGSITAEFREAAADRISMEKLASISLDGESIEKSDPLGRIRNIRPGQPLSLTVDINKADNKADTVLRGLQALATIDPDASLILVDQGKFVASAPAGRVIAFLAPPDEPGAAGNAPAMRRDDQDRMQEAIASGDRNKWLDLPGFTDASISAEQDNLEALQRMDDAGLRSVIVVDAEDRPVGIAGRDAIVAHLVRKLASDV